MSQFIRPIDRRSALKRSLLAAASLVGLTGCTATSPRDSGGGVAGPLRRTPRIARIAHFTDLHIQPERGAAAGVARALRHAQSMPDPPTLIVTGGDLVMDAYDQAVERTREVFDLLTTTLRAECSIPVRHTLGNHDIWGWNRGRSGMTGNEPMYGKAYALDRLGMHSPYHWFDIEPTSPGGGGGWRVVVLDSVRPSREAGSFGYEAFLDEPQRDWLAGVLRDTPRDRWMLVVSHVPIVSAASLFDNDPKVPIRIKPNLVHDDANLLHDLFVRHPNVRLALAGHMHQIDRVEYGGMTYICAGAVCAGWWNGPHRGCNEGFSIVDLYDDGTHRWSYEPYGWTAQA